MVTNYDEYLLKPKSLSISKMHEIHRLMIEEISGDADALIFYDELIGTATRYASFRASWALWNREEKFERDVNRTSCHNALIVKYNTLARYLKTKGNDAIWRDLLGYEEEDKYFRKTMGDFACYLVFVNALNAR